MHKHDWLGRARKVQQRGPGMNPQQRLTAAMNLAAPWQMHTPDQQFFREDAAGTWQSDIRMGTHAAASSITRHPDGTCDLVNLDSDGSSWFDLGGQGGRDVRAGRC